MTTPHQTADQAFGITPDLAALVGQGAYVVGGGSSGFGQTLTETSIRSLIAHPGRNLANAVTDLPAFLAGFTSYLHSLPLEALQIFREFLPPALVGTFDTVEHAVETIMSALNLGRISVDLAEFTTWLGDIYHILETEVHQFLDVLNGLIVTPITSRVQVALDWFNAVFDVSDIPKVLGTAVQGFEDAASIFENLQNLADGLGTAFHLDAGSYSLSEMFTQAQDKAQKAFDAFAHALDAKNTLAIRTNKPAFSGLEPTGEATFHLSDFPAGATLPTASVAGGSSVIGFLRAAEVATKGFVEFMAQGNGGTGIYVNVYKMDPITLVKTALWSSSDISAQVPNGSFGWVRALMPNGSQPAVAAGDLVMLEIVNGGAGTLSVAAKQMGHPDHPTAVPKNFGGTRSTAGTGGHSPASLTDVQITYSGTVPYVSFGISDVPAGYHPPEIAAFSGAGSHTYTIPLWVVDGDLIPYALLGAGGGGGSATGAVQGQGGRKGNYVTGTLVMGTDIPSGTTSLTLVLASGGAGGTVGGGGHNGAAGGQAVLSVPVLGGITAAGGAGGVAGLGSGTSGQGPGNLTYQDIAAFGGNNVAVGRTGAAPGGGGGGGTPFSSGLAGAPAAAWIEARQA